MNAEQQKAATTPGKWVMVIAGPGSGKTKTVVERARHLVSLGTAPAAMAFVTFTNSGARVLRERLHEAIGEVGYVGTLHGMMLKFLRREDPRWVMVGEDDSDEFLARHAKTLGYKGTAADLKAARMQPAGSQARRVVRSYQQWMREEHLLDFDMVLTEGLALLRRKPDVNPWPCYFVDEFQDSAPADAEIYLAVNPEWLFVCGDSDQSIFEFRGARPQNMRDYWDSGRFERHMLNLNYRCGQEICDAANAVIALNPNRIEKQTISALGAGAVIETEAYPTDAAERQAVAAAVGALIFKGVASEEIAVLCRTNRLADEIRAELAEAEIPVAQYEAERKPRDWRLLLLIIQQIASPRNWANARLLAREQARIQKTNPEEAERNLEKYRASCPTGTLWALPSLHVVLSLNADFSRFGISKATHALLADRARMFGPDSAESLLEALRASPEAKATRGVNVMTAHAAKGAEFAAVVVAGADMYDSHVTEDMESERRLFFVALTRGKRYLTVTAARTRRLALPNGQTIVKPMAPGELFDTVAALQQAAV